MTGISLDITVATIAGELPRAAKLFHRHDISFCAAAVCDSSHMHLENTVLFPRAKPSH